MTNAFSARRLSLLLALAVFINFVDRGNLATAAPVVAKELHLSATQVGILLSSFYWTYAVSQLGAGWLAERYPVQRVIAAGFALWCVATIATGFASTFVALLCLRLVLGLGESVAFPCSSKMLAQNVAVDRRGRSNGDIAIGLALGPAFGTFAGGLILAQYGWRALFFSFGALSLLWLIPWLTGPARTLPVRTVEQTADSPSFLEIIRQRAAIGAGLGHFCANYIFYFVLAWLPYYLVDVRGYSLTRMGTIGGLTYAMHALGAYVTGLVGRQMDRERRVAASRLPHHAGGESDLIRGLSRGRAAGRTAAARREPARGWLHLRARVADALRGGAAARGTEGGGAVDRLSGRGRKSRGDRGAGHHGISGGSHGKLLQRVRARDRRVAARSAGVDRRHSAHRAGEVGRGARAAGQRVSA